MRSTADNDTRRTAALTTVLVLAGVLSWLLSMRLPEFADPSALSDFPLQVEEWNGSDLPLDGDVERMLGADLNLFRSYQHSYVGSVWLYVGYYGTSRGGRPAHTPWMCYPSNGWKILRHGVVNLEREQGTRANEFLVEKNGERHLVLFWYQSHRRAGMIGGLDQTLDAFLGRLMDGRSDGSLVRLSTVVDDRQDEIHAQSILFSFSRDILPLLRARWPTESSRPAQP